MDDVRLTPAERRALEEIEAELRKDRDLDRAMRRMRAPKQGRHLTRRQRPRPPAGTAAGDDAAPGEHPSTAAPAVGSGHGDATHCWLLGVLLTIALFAAMLSLGTVYFLVLALVAITLAATAGVVWMCVTLYMRGPNTG